MNMIKVLDDHKLWLGNKKKGKQAGLYDVDLTGINLRYSDLRYANFIDVNFTNADLRGANLSDAYLRGSNFSYSDLRYTKFREASLSGVNLFCANLEGTDFSGANLRFSYNYICLGYDKRGYHFRAVKYETGWLISAGCHLFTIEQAIDHWSKKGNKDALARVAIVQTEIVRSS